MIQGQKLVSKTSIRSLFLTHCRWTSGKKPPCDMIGPSDKISNLHPIKYAIRENETPLEADLRKHREELQAWNEIFWRNHNLSFVDKKSKFEKNELSKKESDNQTLSADELSVFYKRFLDDNWKTHLNYLLEWYRRNIFVTYLHFKVNFQKLLKKS